MRKFVFFPLLIAGILLSPDARSNPYLLGFALFGLIGGIIAGAWLIYEYRLKLDSQRAMIEMNQRDRER